MNNDKFLETFALLTSSNLKEKIIFQQKIKYYNLQNKIKVYLGCVIPYGQKVFWIKGVRLNMHYVTSKHIKDLL